MLTKRYTGKHVSIVLWTTYRAAVVAQSEFLVVRNKSEKGTNSSGRWTKHILLEKV